jgi:hypothetical protein
MKILLPLAVSIAGAASLGSAWAQVPAQPHSLSLKVEPLSSGSETGTSESTRESRPPLAYRPGEVAAIHNKQTQTNKQGETMQVTVRNFGVLPDAARVEWYFVAVPVKPDAQTPIAQQESIYDKGSKAESLGAGGADVFPITSKDLDSKISKSSREHMGNKGKIHRDPRASREKESGFVAGGWMVRLVADGRVVDARGSTDALEAVAKDDSQLKALKGF